MALNLINIIFCLISTVLVFIAPDYYSYNFCTVIAILYICHNILFWIFRNDKNILCFEFFFMISFGFTNFIYPVFYYPVNAYVSLFGFPFNELLISKGTAIAYFAYTFYMLGISNLKGDKQKPEKKKPPFVFEQNNIRLIFLITLMFFVLYVFSGGLQKMKEVYSAGGDLNDVGLFSYFNMFFTILCCLLAMFVFRQTKKSSILFYLGFIILCIISFLSTGSRALPVSLILILITSFNNEIKKISPLLIFIGIFIGAISLYFIMGSRSEFSDANFWENAWADFQINSFLDMFLDLIINNRNLYVLIDYTDTQGFTYFTGMINDLLSPVPGLFSYVHENVIGGPRELISGGHIPTYLQFGEGSAFGLGTNMVGEAYKAFGLMGVIIFFYAIGWIIKKTKMASDYNIYAYMIYYLFVSHAIFYPRGPILFNPRLMVWSIVILFLIVNLTNKKKIINHKTKLYNVS